ncbi:MAG: hypothetical protein JOZ08_13665 [Verrucomicrobia bacterium]|nr:hypothetical protein [Verrucomicrobiota bacterium]
MKKNIRRIDQPRSSCALVAALQLVTAVLFALLLGGVALSADPTPVRHQEGTLHGFLMLRTLDGKTIASAPGSKPVLVKLAISPGGQERFLIQGLPEKANHFVVRPGIEGIPGLLASIFGKQPPDTYVWVLGGEAPTFLKLQTPAYEGGPMWVTELGSPQ